ncbi:MAG: precorrin-6y C5,15-methyltransferase (decarboxylating) subunit CbiE [Desulfatibacillaceae bacterium]
MIPVAIVGVGLSRADLTQRHLDVIREASVLVGGARHLSWFEDHEADKREITTPLSAVVDDVRKWAADRKVVVLASGDPLFYGIGRKLVEALGGDAVEVFPNVSTLAAAFARLKRPWQDARVVSLHGRNGENALARELDGAAPVFVFTDPKHGPGEVARIAGEHAAGDFVLVVFERLGEPDERVRTMPLEDARTGQYLEPNAAVLLPVPAIQGQRAPILGAPDHWYAHERGMITKSEVRAVSLAKLRLLPESRLWDLGAGSGSVSVEAALFITGGAVTAVEKNPRRVGHIRENAARFGAGVVTVVEADLPDGLDALPDPDRVFIGGGGPALPGLIELSAARLPVGGRIVVNVVVLETLTAALEAFRNAGMEPEVVQMQVSEGTPMPGGLRFTAKNPVWIVWAEKRQCAPGRPGQ